MRELDKTREQLLAENMELRAQIAAFQQSKPATHLPDGAAVEVSEHAQSDSRLLAEAMPHIVWITDAQGVATYFNQRWFAYTGLSFTPAQEGGWQVAIHADDCAQAATAWAEALLAGEMLDTEARLRRSDGLYRWHLCRAIPARNRDGRIVAWYGTATDINDQKRMEVAQRVVASASAFLTGATSILPAIAGIVRLPVSQLAHWCSIDLYIEGQTAVRTIAYVDPAAINNVQVVQQDLPDSVERFTHPRTHVGATIPAELLADSAPGSAYLRTLCGIATLYVPLNLHNRVLGAITLIGADGEKGFDHIVIKTFEGVARRVVAAIENTQLTKAMAAALKLRDQALAEAESQRRYFYDLLMDAPAYIHIVRGPEHIFEFANTRSQALFGHQALLGKALLDVLPEIEGQTYKEILDHVYTTGKLYACTEVHATLDRHNDGNLEHVYLNLTYQPIVETDGMVTGVFSTAIEVTDQVQARQRVEELALQLGQQAAQLNAIIEAMPDAVYVCDTDGRLTMVNARGIEVLGLPATHLFDNLQTAQGTVTATYLDGTPIPFEAQPLIRALRGETGNDHRSTIKKADSGEEIQLNFSYAPIRGADNTITGAVSIASDITALHRLEQQKDAFLSIAAHELKTPITSIKGQVQLAARRLARTGQSEEAAVLHHVDKQINRLTALINELTDVSRIQSDKFEMQPMPFDFAALLRGAADALQATTSQHYITINAPGSLELVGDPDRLEQVLTNLIGNAIKYSPDGGTISLTLERSGDEAFLSVADEGIGIPLADRPHLFERFHRASNAKEYRVGGFGLGLFICSQIIQAHKGRIWLCEPAPGKHGTTFCVALPLA